MQLYEIDLAICKVKLSEVGNVAALGFNLLRNEKDVLAERVISQVQYFQSFAHC